MSDTIAVIDIGTNSALLLIVRRDRGKLVSLHEASQTPRLGAGLAATGIIGLPAAQRLVRSLGSYLRICDANDVSTVIAVGTKVFRTARNAPDVAREIAGRTGLHVCILSAREEASYAFRGALSGLPRVQSGVLVDIGGGSTELVLFRRRKIVSALSLPLGCVSLAETKLRRFCGISDRRLEAARDAVGRFLPRIPQVYRQYPTGIIGVGGTLTTLAAMDQRLSVYRPERVHGCVFNCDQIEDHVQRFRDLSAVEIRGSIPFDPDRAAVLPAGTFLWAEVLKHLCAQFVIVSHRGLRWGVAQQYFEAAHR